MEIIDGFIAVVMPYIVSICPHADGWGVIVYGGPEAKKTVEGIIAKHFAQTASGAKLWAKGEITSKSISR